MRNYEEMFEADLAEMELRNRVALEKRCADTMPGTLCAKYKARGLCRSASIAAKCPVSCDTCSAEDEEVEEEEGGVCQDQKSKYDYF